MSLAGGARGRARALELWRIEVQRANAAGECRFRGLPRGLYSLKAGGREWAVLVERGRGDGSGGEG